MSSILQNVCLCLGLLLYDYAFRCHFGKGFPVALGVYPSKGGRYQVYFHPGLEQVFAGTPYAEFRSYPAYIDVSCVKQPEDIFKRLACAVGCFSSGVLFFVGIRAFEERQPVLYVRHQLFVDLSAMSALYAVTWPVSAVFLE